MTSKHLIPIALLTLFSSIVKAQLNKSKGQVMQFMSNDSTLTFDKSGRTKDSFEFLSYSIPTKVLPDGHISSTTKVFYFFNDTCFLIKIIKPNNQLNNVIKDLNYRFVPMGDNIWFDEKEKAKYEIVLKENDSVFTVQETPWKN